MKIRILYIILFFIVSTLTVFSQDEPVGFSKKDTMYNSLATTKIQNMIIPGKAPKVTLQLSFNYDIGHMDLAGNENTIFRKSEFISGSNFGTRYGYGAQLTGKIALHKQGNVRLNISAAYNRFLSNFVISESPDGKVAYNVKPYIGFEIMTNLISGNATLSTDSTDFDLKIKNSIRFGAALHLGFEYAINNKVGLNLGYKISHANIIGKESKVSSNPNETVLNDDKYTSVDPVPYGGWKQFVYSSFYAGFNFYFGMKNKK